MSQHDFDIANQTAPNTRADLNLALKALASNSSGASAPTTTYANMIYYNTSTNILYKRNEADSAWITLGTVDESLGTFTPSGLPPIASQAEAETGTNNTKTMTPLRVEEHMIANTLGWGQTWQNVTASRELNTSYQNTTGKPIAVAIGVYGPTIGLGGPCFQVSSNGSTWINVSFYSDPAVQQISTIIPDNWYYRTINVNAISAGNGWAELR